LQTHPDRGSCHDRFPWDSRSSIGTRPASYKSPTVEVIRTLWASLACDNQYLPVRRLCCRKRLTPTRIRDIFRSRPAQKPTNPRSQIIPIFKITILLPSFNHTRTSRPFAEGGCDVTGCDPPSRYGGKMGKASH
jgi:hypothetical protein